MTTLDTLAATIEQAYENAGTILDSLNDLDKAAWKELPEQVLYDLMEAHTRLGRSLGAIRGIEARRRINARRALAAGAVA